MRNMVSHSEKISGTALPKVRTLFGEQITDALKVFAVDDNARGPGRQEGVRIRTKQPMD